MKFDPKLSGTFFLVFFFRLLNFSNARRLTWLVFLFLSFWFLRGRPHGNWVIAMFDCLIEKDGWLWCHRTWSRRVERPVDEWSSRCGPVQFWNWIDVRIPIAEQNGDFKIGIILNSTTSILNEEKCHRFRYSFIQLTSNMNILFASIFIQSKSKLCAAWKNQSKEKRFNENQSTIQQFENIITAFWYLCNIN